MSLRTTSPSELPAPLWHGNALRVEHVARRSVVPGAISQPNQIDSLVAVELIYAGEQISTRRSELRRNRESSPSSRATCEWSRFREPSRSSSVATLKEGDRSMSLAPG